LDINVTESHTHSSISVREQSPVAKAIRDEIASYLADNPQLSLRAMAQRDSELSREYIRKLAKAEISDEKLNQDKVLRILQIISKKQKLTDVINHFNSNISQYLKESYKVTYEHEVEITSESIEKALNESDDLCIAYHLAHTSAGITAQRANEVMGVRGESALQTLEGRGLIEKDSRIYKAKSSNFFIPALETMHKIAQTLMRLYRTKHFGRKRNYIMTITGSLNQMGIEAEQELFRKFHKDLLNLYEDGKNQGDIPCFATAAMDSFTVLKDDNEKLH